MANLYARLAREALPSLAIFCWSSAALAAVPAEYTGKPYQGTPQQIPGRVELANLDEGGLNVAFFADHRRDNAVAEGYAPISGDDYRPGNLNLPNICKTNRAQEAPGQGSEDFWEDGSRYPSDAMPYVYYMGYAHTVDWVRVTVNVKQAGKYNVSSNWACANDPCGLSLWFNDGSGQADNPARPLDGVNKSGKVSFSATNDYHKWRKYPNFTQVELSAGEQVMTFHVEVNNHLQYGFLQFDAVDGVPEGGGGSGGVAAGGSAGVAGGETSGSSAGGATGSAGSSSSAAGSAPLGTSGAAASAGTAPTASGGAPGAGTGTTSGSNVDSGSSCAVSPLTNAGRASGVVGLLFAGSLLLRRRRA